MTKADQIKRLEAQNEELEASLGIMRKAFALMLPKQLIEGLDEMQDDIKSLGNRIDDLECELDDVRSH